MSEQLSAMPTAAHGCAELAIEYETHEPMYEFMFTFLLPKYQARLQRILTGQLVQAKAGHGPFHPGDGRTSKFLVIYNDPTWSRHGRILIRNFCQLRDCTNDELSPHVMLGNATFSVCLKCHKTSYIMSWKSDFSKQSEPLFQTFHHGMVHTEHHAFNEYVLSPRKNVFTTSAYIREVSLCQYCIWSYMTRIPRILTGANTTKCEILEQAGVNNIFYPHTPLYTDHVHSYWSLTSQLTPTCFVQPETTEEVSKIVRILFQQEDCKFAVRSGGHSSNAGANNIEEGVTIDLGRMNVTTYNSTTGTASLRPGARWLDVYRTLDVLNVSIQGGAIGSVGVGGLLLGGGFSPYLYQRGFALDDILAHEVVLANGTVVSATSDVNADLHQTLKGAGANNFGIVTRYDMRTFDRAPLWSVYREYPASEGVVAAHIRALECWTNNADAYETGSAFVWWTYRPRENRTILISALTDTAGRARPRVMEEFLGITGHTVDEQGLTNMSTSAQAFQATGYRNIWFTLTFKNDARVITKAVNLHRQFVEDMKQISSDGDFETQCYFQPFPAVIGQRGAEKGGNILGIENLKDNAIVLLGSLAVNGVDQEAMGRQKILAWKDAVEEYSKNVGAFVSYRYINYADASQDVLWSYGSKNFGRMRAVSRKYDPKGVFQKRVSGVFKLFST